MKTLLTFFVLLLSSSVFAEDISDFEIGGISAGDSLLDLISEEEINKEIKRNRNDYAHLGDEFGEVYFDGNSPNYDYLSFFVKTPYITKDNEYFIYLIRGIKQYEGNNIDQCYKKMNIIEEGMNNEILSNAERFENSFNHRIDPSGKSLVKEITYIFDSGDRILFNCIDFEENLRIQNNWTEGLSVSIVTSEIYEWFYPNK